MSGPFGHGHPLLRKRPSMSTAALTAKYRPQTFAEVAGQDTLKAILSRAALEGRVAPAYLFSGTRGVGKTTLARIFAKALNCRTAPTAEPCNACDICRAVTLGNAVDVIEIDGASNRGIDDVRRLKEVVGYAPMDGRFKVFIIDEAHMLSREAFNALLKTLEEPPSNVTFILATTEPHKFPATIISRCQHFVFKRLPEKNIEQHLAGVLDREKVAFDERAVRLIARRGAGSVRDAMSLLGQVLALGNGSLTEEAARSVLGLAGQEVLANLVSLLGRGETLPVVSLLRELLDQGLDLGFFLRELGGLWRDMFILKQSGEAGLAAVDLPLEESRLLLDLGAEFSLTHIHACWQMTLEGQRRVLTSLEPGLALELLLLNIAMLPQLLSLDAVSALVRRTQRPAPSPSGSPYPRQTAPERPAPPVPAQPQTAEQPAQGTGQERPRASEFSERPASGASPAGEPDPDPLPSGAGERIAAGSDTLQTPDRVTGSPSGKATDRPAGGQASDEMPPEGFFAPAASSEADFAPVDAEDLGGPPDTSRPDTPRPDTARPEGMKAQAAGLAPEQATEQAMELVSEQVPEQPSTPPSGEARPLPSGTLRPGWEAIIARAVDMDAPPGFAAMAASVTAAWRNNALVMESSNAFAVERLSNGSGRQALERALESLVGHVPELSVLISDTRNESKEVLRERVMASPGIQNLESLFGARVMDFGQIRK